jgi:phenylacetic acid degradation operon negative regulatory protein
VTGAGALSASEPGALSASELGALSASEPLAPQDLVITLLGTYVRPRGVDTVWSGGLVTLLGELGFSEGAARVSCTRLVNRGLLARVRSGRLVHYRITERADRLLAEGDGRIFTLGDPRDDGGTWTALWHQIPEDRRLERSRLARRLRFLGFGSVQDSVWVSPHDHQAEVSQLVADLGVAAFATVFLARVGDGSGLAALVGRAWDLTGLVDRYAAFAAEFSPYATRSGRAGLEDSEAFLVRTRLVHLFRGFPPLDPELPEELAPLSGPRGRAVKTFHAVFDGLARPSQRYFESMAGSGAASRSGG